MPNKAKSYIACTVAIGLAILAAAIFRWPSSDVPRYLTYFLLGLVASTLKVRLPGIEGTMSVNFLFILIGVAEFSFSETVALACAAAVIQSFWKAKRRPMPVQVIFNAACLAISSGLAYSASHFALAAANANSLPVLMALAASLFFVTNTGLVATVVCLVEERPLKEAWERCYSSAFPYYLVGAAIAGLISVSSRSAGWKVSLLALPLMYLTHVYYRLHLTREAQEQPRFSTDDDRELEAAPHFR